VQLGSVGLMRCTFWAKVAPRVSVELRTTIRVTPSTSGSARFTH
jgi:hypothetical protein